jgi:hypothetical protein
MANGTHALQLLAPEPAPAVVDKPVTEIETKIGEEVAVGVIALCKVIVSHHETGMFAPEIKDAVVGQVAAVAMLGLDHEDDADFIRKARKAGHARLRQYFTDDCRIPPGTDAVINICIDEMLGLVSQIVKDERIFRNNWAN